MDSIRERLNKFLTDSTDLGGYVFAPEQLFAFIKEELNGLAQTIESEALLTGRHEMIHAATIIRTEADLL